MLPMFRQRKNQDGFSFIEIMTTVAVLSLGILAVYQSFFKSLDYLNHMTYRLHALNILSNKIELVQKRLEVSGEIALNEPTPAIVSINGKTVEFQQDVQISDVHQLKNIYRLDVTLSWQESGRNITLSRSCYIYYDNPKKS